MRLRTAAVGRLARRCRARRRRVLVVARTTPSRPPRPRTRGRPRAERRRSPRASTTSARSSRRRKSEADASASTAKTTVDDAWSQWLKIEGRIKKNDTGAYLEFEDALSDMRVGAQEDEPPRSRRARRRSTRCITSYLAGFPG